MAVKMIRFIQYALAGSFLLLCSCGDEVKVDKGKVDDRTGHEHASSVTQETSSDSSLLPTQVDWCAEHSVPESQCTKCNPSLVAQFKESGDWCQGHGLPESHCRLCNPGIVFPQEKAYRDKLITTASTDISVSLYFRPNSPTCATDSALIQFATPSTVERAGITCQTVRASSSDRITEAPAEVVFDESEASVVTTTVSALVSRWIVSPGDYVHNGDILAYVTSAEIGELRSSLLTAHTTARIEKSELSRQKALLDRKLISTVEYEKQASVAAQAESELSRVKSLLISAGLSAKVVDDTSRHGEDMNQFALTSPSDGLVVERKAKLGELLAAGEAFAIIANPNAMWIEARMTEDDIAEIHTGQQATFTSDGHGLNRVGASVVWVSKFLDPQSRTGTVRAKVMSNTDGLRAGELGRMEIHELDKRPVVLVPRDAIQWEGCCNVVFVRESSERYRPRKVQILSGTGQMYEVLSGVQAGEDVVVGGSFLLKTELKKSSIGAGCCEVEPIG